MPLPNWRLSPEEMEAAQARIRMLIATSPDDWPGAPMVWVPFRDTPALDAMTDAGEIESVEGRSFTRPGWRTYVRFRKSAATAPSPDEG